MVAESKPFLIVASLLFAASCAEGSLIPTGSGGGAEGGQPGTGAQTGSGADNAGGAGASDGGSGAHGSTVTSTSTSTSTTTTTTTTGAPFCGDDDCGAGETCGNCPSDCGSCCPNGSCDNGETTATCAADCPSTCPNGTCEASESAQSCPDDCETGDCAHDPCDPGGPLALDCDSCAAAVCFEIPECCILGWDAACVTEAEGQNFFCSC